MTPEQQEAKRKAEVMLAFANGKAIEYKSHNLSDQWNSTPAPRWDWQDYNYRVKPEPKELWAVYRASGSLVASSFTTEAAAVNYAVQQGSMGYRIVHMREVTDE